MISLDLKKLHRFIQFSFDGEPIEYRCISRDINLAPTRKYKDITAFWRNVSRYLTIKGVIKAKVPRGRLKRSSGGAVIIVKEYGKH